MIGVAILIGLIPAADPAAAPALAAAPTAEQIRFYETSVRPVFVEHCWNCHGEKKQWGDLRLDSRESLLRGGENGAVVQIGRPGESRLIRAVRQIDDDFKMPPEGKLTDRQIADLSRWIEMGAPYPAAEASRGRQRDPNHWAFQPPVEPSAPVVAAAAWSRSPVDDFIAREWEARGIAPAAVADKHSLVRRITFDLTGLPPTTDESTAFAADENPDAWERLIDRLLAAPSYGERWGRHWLDVARYADSNGLDENIAHGNAWRYRDYVVASFNADKPFDRFTVEQIAGDLLPAATDAARAENLIATGFLAIGPKVLAEVDETKMQMDIVDEQIDTVGRAFLGLTLGCARCHDHKFDPIDTADYYGLAGVFKSTRTMEHFKKIAKWHENPLPSAAARALQAEYEASLAAKKSAVENAVAAANAELRRSLAADAPLPEKPEAQYPAETQASLKKLRDELAAAQKAPPELPAAMGTTEDKPADVPVHVRGSHLKLGDVIPRHFPPAVRGPRPTASFPADRSGREELARWIIDPQHPLTGRVLVNRVWRQHFGRGIVRTADNFGSLGERPSHPELLDWLSLQLQRDGWSLKTLHRRIVSSAVYRQSSVPAANTLTLDPDNRWFSRTAVRRLEAEAVRDALLAVGENLDRTFGGSLLTIKNRQFFFDHTSKDLTDYTSRRRSLYLPVVRNNVYDVFQLLDYPDAAVSTGDRPTTTVAPQALLMLNGRLVIDAAATFSARLAAEVPDERDRLRLITEIAYGRVATPEEIAADLAYLNQLDAAATTIPDAAARRRQAWNVYCHTILAANEFVYVK